MSLSFNSISESAIGELPSSRPVADLEVELFGENSFAFNLPTDTVPLVLSYANDEVALTLYGGNPGPWVIPLTTAASDVVQNIYNFVDTAELTLSADTVTSTVLNSVETSNLEVSFIVTVNNRFEIPADTIELTSSITSVEQPSWLISDPAVLSFDGEYFHNLRLYSTETGVLSIEVVEKQFADDVPSEAWRDRQGLPISPISFNAIGVEQSSGPIAKSFPDIAEVGLEINVETTTSTTLFADTNGNLVLQDTSTESHVYNYVDSGNLTTISISDQVSFLNSNETLILEIAATDQVQQVFEFVDTAELELGVDETTSTSFNYIDSGNLTTITIRDVVVYLNSNETLSLEIAATDQVQQVFEYVEVAELNLETTFETSASLNSVDTVSNQIISEPRFSTVMSYVDEFGNIIVPTATESKLSNYVENVPLTTEPNDLISIRYYSFSSANVTVDAKTFAKEYTFLQQEYADDTINLTISAESGEQFRSGAGGVARAKQIWIG